MIHYTTANSKSDLEGILLLQNANLAQGLSREEIQSQGFVTVKHSFDQLKKLNDFKEHIIAKENEKVIGYVLAMTQQSKFDIPVLIPMFDVFSNILYANKRITEYNFIVVGQVCMDKNYRGQGIFDRCYYEYEKHYKDEYDFAITEIASTNMRSLNAHKRIGFHEIHKYISPDKTEWVIVLWDWKNGK